MQTKRTGAIAAGHPKTVEAGRIAFEMGGNAFDAIVASALASFVVEFTLASAGGGGFILTHTQERENLLFDCFCQTPRRSKNPAEVEFYPVSIDFGGASQEFHIGRGSIATPGALSGLWEVSRRLGKLPFSVLAEPAIAYAREGFILSRYNAFCIRLLEGILRQDREGMKIYGPQGELLQEGDRCVMSDFANTLSELSTRGIEDFYRGEIAHQIDRDLQTGGYVTLADLGAYRTLVRRPLSTTYRGYDLLTNPPPSSGGILIAFALKWLENCDFSGISCLDRPHLGRLAEAMAVTNQARAEAYDRSIHQEGIEEEFLSPEFLATYGNKWGSTTHISVLDSEGNAASATFSNGEGSAYTIPGTGIILNNMLGEADLNPLGFHHWPSDRRISSMMSPTIVLQAGRPRFVLGSGGSNRIRTAILQVISHLLDFGQPLDTAVKNARIHWESGQLDLEPFPGREEAIAEALFPHTSRVSLWQERNMFFGGVHAVGILPSGELTATGDLRRDGVGLVISDP
jgi:gamma-glutamyltranspeptidase / glutathione hydrolase